MFPTNFHCALAFALAGELLCSTIAHAQTVRFTDQTVAAGLTAIHTAGTGSGQMGWMTGGLAAGDFDGDGWQDLFVLGGPGAPDKLYINNRDGTFTDRAAAWGVARSHWGYGVAVGDFDNDGRLDIYITSGGTDNTPNHHILYHNNGDGTFTDVAQQAGVRTTATSMYDGFGAAWGDYDLDGYLDLAVAGWQYGSGGNKLFHNNGNGTFTDVTSNLNTPMTYVMGFSPKFIDMNGDRYPELLWVSDFGTSRYFINNGGAFANATASAGVGFDGNGMGTTTGDFNNDGRPDWYVTSIFSTPQNLPGVPGTGNMLYMNLGNHHYSEVGAPAGVRQAGWGWGTTAVDLRNAGRMDIVATNGWPDTYYGTQFLADPSCVFLNGGAGTFANSAPSCGITHTGEGRGLINLDYNNDGSQDIIIATNGGALSVYRNEIHGPGAAYLRVFLNTQHTIGLAPNGYGAHVVATSGGVSQHRWITGGSNYLSQSELSAHFGLGASTSVQTLRVEWPNGVVTFRSNIPANRTITIGSCASDWNGDGSISLQDIFDFLADWFAGAGDFDASGASNVQDIFGFLAGWFAGC